MPRRERRCFPGFGLERRHDHSGWKCTRALPSVLLCENLSSDRATAIAGRTWTVGLKTRVCDLLGIDHPIVLGGMGGAGSPALAAAVSEAGGLGVLGGADCGAEELREKIAEVRRLTRKPFGVNTLLPASVRRQSQPSEQPSKEQLARYREIVSRFLADEGLQAPAPEDHARLQGLARPAREGLYGDRKSVV